MSSLTNQIIGGVAIGVPSFVLGYLGYIRATRVDRVTEQVGVASGRTDELNLVVVGLNQLIDQLQEDNRTLREEIKSAAQRLVSCAAESESRAKKLRHLHRKYPDNGDNGENGA